MSSMHHFVAGAQWVAIGALICSVFLVRVLVAYANPVRRPLAWLVVVVVLGFAAFTFQLMILNALSSGEVTCLGKGCERNYSWAEERPMFWANIVVLQGLTCGAWALTAYALGVVFGLWPARSNKTMEPTR
jgi:uncharacterized protein YhhL (DUF1145 family)